MSYVEFVQWQIFYEKHPFDDFHRFIKPAALLAASFTGGEMSSFLDILLSKKKEPETQADIDRSILAAFGGPSV